MFEKYFERKEIVSGYVYNMGGGYELLDDNLKKLIVWIREGLNRPMTVNTWRNGGQFSQRGYRTNDDPVCYAQKFIKNSPHFKGMALDFDVKDMTANDVREWIRVNQNSAPCKFRCENNVNWVHVDVKYHTKQTKCHFFDA